MNKKIIFLVLSLLVLPGIAYAENKWLYGDVAMIEEYGSISNGTYGILITLENKIWPYGDLAACTGQLRLKTGLQGMTDEVKQRIFAMTLSSSATGQEMGLFVGEGASGAICDIQAARSGKNLPR